MQKNENRSGYKKTKVGWIPQEWRSVKLINLTSTPIKNGYSPICPDEPSGKWILGLGALNGNGFDPTQIKPAPAGDARVDNFLLASGDFLISRSNTQDKVGRSALFRGEIPNCSYPDLMMRFRVKKESVYPDYLDSFLRSFNSARYLQRSASGTSGTMVKINKATVEKIPVLLPPLPEQKAIAGVLSVWDRAISTTERLIQAKEKRFAWLLNTLINKGSEKGEWRRVKLGELFEKELVVEKGKPLIKDNTKLGKIPVVAGGQSYAYYHNESTHKGNCITISASGAYAGFIWFHEHPIWASDCNVIYAKTGLTQFFYYALKAQQHRVFSLQSGGAQPHVYAKDLKNLPISVPPLPEQKRIAKTLNTAQREIELLKKLAEKQKEQKRGLMQKLLTGEWRVEGA